MATVLVVGRAVRASNTLLLMGVMPSYLVSSAVTVLLAGASPLRVRQFVEWEFGSYLGASWPDLHVLVLVLAAALHAVLLEERYANHHGRQ